VAKRAKKEAKTLVLKDTGALMKTEYRMAQFLNALADNMGMTYTACNNMEPPLSHATFIKWSEDYPDFVEKVHTIQELIKDKVELKIIDKAINEADNDMLKHYSNAKMRERGYGKADTTNGTTINVQLHLHPEDEDDDDEKGDYTEFEEVKE